MPPTVVPDVVAGALFAVAAGLPIELAQIPWSFVMAFASLGLIYVLFRSHHTLFEDLGFTGREVALLALGSIAGWAVNIPVFVAGGTYVAINMGGTVVPLILIGWWVRKRKLRPLATLVGTALVSVTAWRIVSFEPSSGIVTRYPYFFAPVVVALAFALLVSFRRPVTGVPVAYASGTLGALIGADLMHLPEIRQHFLTAPENTIISIGGAGVFDMVFLAGAFAMALHLALVAFFATKRRAPEVSPAAYPGKPLRLRDSRRVWASYLKLHAPNAHERALAGLALSDIALREGDSARSLRMSWLAIDSLLRDDHVRAYLARDVPAALTSDVDLLGERYRRHQSEPPTLSEAGAANHTARHLLPVLAPHTRAGQRLEGVA